MENAFRVAWILSLVMRLLHSARLFVFASLVMLASVALAQQSPKQLDVEGFSHADYIRVVFRSSQGIEADVQKDGREVSVRFAEPVAFNAADVLAALKSHVSAARLGNDKQRLILTLKDADARVRKFQSTRVVGVDVVFDKVALDATSAQADGGAPVSLLDVFRAAGADDESAPQSASPATRSDAQAVRRATREQAPELTQAARGYPRNAPESYPVPIGDKPEFSSDDKFVLYAQKPAYLDADAAESEGEEPADYATEGDGFSIDKLPEEEVAEEAVPEITEDSPIEELMKVVQVKDATKMALKFSPKFLRFINAEGMATAMFVRGHRIWIVFSESVKLDLDDVDDRDFLRSYESIQEDEYSVLILEVNPIYSLYGLDPDKTALFLKTYKNEVEWQIEISLNEHDTKKQVEYRLETADELSVDEDLTSIEVDTSATDAIAVDFVKDAETPHVFLRVNRPGNPIKIADPYVGDSLVVVPIEKPGVAIIPDYRFVDFVLPETLQGIVIKPLNDKVLYKTTADGVAIAMEGNFNISRLSTADQLAQEQLADPENSKFDSGVGNTIFPFSKRYTEQKENAENDLANYYLERTVLYKKLVSLTDQLATMIADPEVSPEKLASKQQAVRDQHLAIAKFFFRHELYAEAKGVIEVMKESDPQIAHLPELNALYGFTLFMDEQYARAQDVFEQLIAFQPDDESGSIAELSLWQWASGAMHQLLERNVNYTPVEINFLTMLDSFMLQYPPELSYRLGLIAIEESINRGELEFAATVMEIVNGQGVPKAMEEHSNYVRGKLYQALGEYELAVAAWKKNIDNPDSRKYRALAEFELIKQQLSDGSVPIKEALERLELLTFVWRGDFVEMDILNLLGELHIQHGNYEEGLQSWQTLVAHFPATKEAIFVAGKMKQVFSELFEEGNAYELEPFEALALYFSFRELTPVGERGDRIVLQLADYFVKADLLEHAAAVLLHQVKYRAQGERKYEIALQLADLHLKNRDTASVRESLKFISPAASTAAKEGKRHLIARAALMDGQYRQVFDILEGDFTPEAQDIRLDVFFIQKNWFGIMNIIESRLTALRDTAPFPLKPHESLDIVRLALAYAAQEDRESLDMLKGQFEERIPGADMRELFAFYTEEVPELDPEQYAQTVELEALERFLNDYAYWPVQDWDSAARVMEPYVWALAPNADNLTSDQSLDVARLALAYAMQDPKNEEEKETLQKKMDNLMRTFRDVKLNRFTISVMRVLDNKFLPFEQDELFAYDYELNRLREVADLYRESRRMSELNAKLSN